VHKTAAVKATTENNILHWTAAAGNKTCGFLIQLGSSSHKKDE
jgi:hypothetical protein